MSEWPPDWRASRLEALIAAELTMGEHLVRLDELEDLVSSDHFLAGEVRQLAARLRTRRNDWRDQVGELRARQAALEEAES